MAGPDVVRQTSTAASLLGATCPGGSRLQEFLGPVAPGGRSRCAGQEPLCWDGRRRCCPRQAPLRCAAGGTAAGGRCHAGCRSCRSHALVSASCVLQRVRVATRGGDHPTVLADTSLESVKWWLEVKGRIRGSSRGVPSEGAGKMRVEKGFGNGRCTICLGG